MYTELDYCNICLDILRTVPYESVNWCCVRWAVQNIKEIPIYWDILNTIYTTAISNNLAYLNKNKLYSDCPGTVAKYIIAFLGVPYYLTNDNIKDLIFTQIYGHNYCICNTPHCDFSKELITPHQ